MTMTTTSKQRRPTGVAGLSRTQIAALLRKTPGTVAPASHDLASYLLATPRLSGAAYDAWVERLSRQRPEDTE